jgi:hypothetical protein
MDGYDALRKGDKPHEGILPEPLYVYEYGEAHP